MAGWYDGRVGLTGRAAPLEVLADRVTPNFFALLGAPASIGRTFTLGANVSDVEPEVILSHGFWQRHYGGDPGVVGQLITLAGRALRALLLAAIGLYDVPARTREIGVRVALGPQHVTFCGWSCDVTCC